jgi:hypothetical protein
MKTIAKTFGLAAAVAVMALTGAMGAAQAGPASYTGYGCDNPVFQGD